MNTTTGLGVGFAVMMLTLPLAHADKCRAEAEFVHSFPANDLPSKFKFKFRVESDDCVKYSCRGYIHYRIHYDYESGNSNTHSTLVRYTIDEDRGSAEVVDETFPSGGTQKVEIRDVEIEEVSCSTP